MSAANSLEEARFTNRGHTTIIDTTIWQNIADGNQIVRGAGIYNAAPGTIRLSSSDVTGNHAIARTSHVRGAGIYNDGTFTATICTINQNHAWGDAGTNQGVGYYESGTGTLSYCDIAGNTNDTDSPTSVTGAGMFIFGETALYRSTVFEHRAASGGGIRVYWTDSVLTLRESHILANGATNGGGLHIDAGSIAFLYESMVAHNEAKGDGGNILLLDGFLLSSNSTIRNGIADVDGGGLYMDASSIAILKNSTVGLNQADKNGGGLYMENGAFTWLTNGTISENSADASQTGIGSGGGIFHLGASSGIMMRNTIVQNNLDLSPGPNLFVAPDCDGPIESLGFNLIGTVGFNALNPGSPPCGISATDNQIGVDAMLLELGQYGGPTPTYALHPNSPAINGGHPDGCLDEASFVLDSDQRGFARPDRCDIGAFEFAGIEQFQQFTPIMRTP